MEIGLSVIVPVYNEIMTIRDILNRIVGERLVREVIIVDDYSTDGTREYLMSLKDSKELVYEKIRIQVLFHDKNKGKGAAIRSALNAVRENVVVIQDADLEYDPVEYKKLLEPIADGRADVVYGSRFLGGPHRVLYFWHFFGNKLLTLLSNIMNNINLSDMETCYKAFRTDILRDLKLRSNRFGFEPEITAKVARRKLRIYEVPISYSGRTYEEGKKITWKDGFAALWTIIRFKIFD